MGFTNSQLTSKGKSVPSDVIDYEKQSALTDNATSNIVVGNTASHYMISIKYGMLRDSNWQFGEVKVYWDGTTAVTDQGTIEGSDRGLSFPTADTDGTDIRLQCALTSTGNDGTLYYDLYKSKK